jgi:hypothetical protein
MSKKRKIGEQPTDHVFDKEFTAYSWRVQWKTKDFPNDWLLFSKELHYPSEALASFEEAAKRPGCLAVRIIERELHTTDIRREVSPEDLKGRI